MDYIKYCFFCLLGVVACRQDSRDKTPDISQIPSDMHLYRFEKDVFAIDTLHIEESVNSLLTRYPTLMRIFCQVIMKFTNRADSTDPKFYSTLKAFVRDPLLQSIVHRTDTIYGQMDDLREQFNRTSSYARYYFPKSRKQNMYTMVSAFNIGNIIFEDSDSTDGLGISMDYYMGSGFDYKRINPTWELFSDYVTRTFNKEHILKKSWMPWIEDIVPGNKLNTLLDHLIYEGKKIYITSKIIPDIQDTVLFEFRPDQLTWCQDNKLNIWSFLKDQNLVNSTKRNEIVRYLNPSPSSPGMPKESPGRAAVFVGYDIVREYMKRNPKLTLQDLAREDNAQKILDEAKYKPENK